MQQCAVKNLKHLLRLRQMTQADLANALGVHFVSVNRWITGGRSPDKRTLQRIADLLQCEVEEITGEINVMTTQERQLLAAFRDMPANQRAAIMAIVATLTKKPSDTEPPQSDQSD